MGESHTAVLKVAVVVLAVVGGVALLTAASMAWMPGMMMAGLGC